MFFEIISIVLAGMSVLASVILITRLKQPTSFAWWGIKVFVGALTPFFILAGIFIVLLGVVTGLFWVIIPGVYSVVVFLLYLYKVKDAIYGKTGLQQAYGPDWESLMTPAQRAGFLSNPIALAIPSPSGYSLRQDIAFCMIPGTGRELLCDVWMPAENVQQSRLAFIYFHGSAWSVLDKDFGTRPFFKHLVSQGHVVMDVAYRLFPETDMTGMVNDVYRAIAWMKMHAADYKVDPGKVVIGGGSAGGHLSLLAAYSSNEALIPAELRGVDLSVLAVISEYGPTDLRAMYDHTGQDIIARRQDLGEQSRPAPTPQWVQNMMGKNFHRLGMDKDASSIGALAVILGGRPEQCPEVYDSFSPVTYVHKCCPQTLIIQGEHDLIAPVAAARTLYSRLVEEGVCTAMYIIPQTDHAFDLILPRLSPVAHTTFYLVERFLAIQANRSLPTVR